MRRKKSEILEVVLETATGLYNAGLMDKITLREFDSLCILPVEPLEPHQIKQKSGKLVENDPRELLLSYYI